MSTPDKKRGCLWFGGGCAAVVVLSLIAGIIVLRVTFKGYRQSGASMEPTILKGDLVLTRPAEDVKRGDLVAFHSPRDGTVYLKRVIGLPGDVVELRDSAAIVNGTPLDEPYIKRDPSVEALRDFGPITVPRRSYFVLGDNRDNSNDSRYLGFIERDAIISKAVAVVSKDGGAQMLDSPR